MTFFDKAGQPVRGNGVEAVRQVDFSRRIVGGPVDHGFQSFFGTACCPTTDWLYAFIENDRVPVPPTAIIDKSKLPKHPYANDCRAGLIAPAFPMEEVDLVFLKKSREFLEQHVRESPSKPFFLFHSAQAVHLPSFAAPQFQGTSDAGPHGDFIVELDFIVGELLTTLETLGVAGNTIVIFTSDNGPETTSVIHMRRDHQPVPEAIGQLYHLATDPGETKNLSAARPEIVAELKALLEQSKSSGRSRPRER